MFTKKIHVYARLPLFLFMCGGNRGNIVRYSCVKHSFRNHHTSSVKLSLHHAFRKYPLPTVLMLYPKLGHHINDSRIHQYALFDNLSFQFNNVQRKLKN